MGSSSGIEFHGIGHKTDLNAGAPGVNILDSSRNKNILVKNGTVTQEQLPSGLWVNAYDGATGRHRGMNLRFPVLTDLTVLVWFYYDTDITAYADGNNHDIFSAYADDNNNFTILKKAAGDWRIVAKGSGVVEVASVVDATLVDKWHLFILRKTSNVLDLLMDCVLRDTQPAATDMNKAINRLSIGGDLWGGGHWPGKIDESVVIKSFSMDANQLKSYYNKTCQDHGRRPI